MSGGIWEETGLLCPPPRGHLPSMNQEDLR